MECESKISEWDFPLYEYLELLIIKNKASQEEIKCFNFLNNQQNGTESN